MVTKIIDFNFSITQAWTGKILLLKSACLFWLRSSPIKPKVKENLCLHFPKVIWVHSQAEPAIWLSENNA